MAKVIEFVSDHLERRKRIQDRLGEMITFERRPVGIYSKPRDLLAHARYSYCERRGFTLEKVRP